MKKILLVSVLLSFSLANSLGQRLSLSVGYNYSTIKHSSDVYSHVDELNKQVKPKSGFNIGVNYEIPLSNVFYIEPGLVFSSKGINTERFDDIGEP